MQADRRVEWSAPSRLTAATWQDEVDGKIPSWRGFIVATMVGLLMPRPGRPAAMSSVPRAARIAAARARVPARRARDYYRSYLDAGGLSPEQYAHRQYGAALKLEPPWSLAEIDQWRVGLVSAMSRPLLRLTENPPEKPKPS
jgi:hypothetical protein